jgi:alkyl sulfatase BDS1-like metallo-beta-lactamase superfamily hydrolase
MTPGTECPAEVNFHFPDHRALCMSENATHNLHNLVTLRGAQVRDARIWSRYLSEAVELFAGSSDVAFASHHWPTWGQTEIVAFLEDQRDLYAYLHDQTLRLMNRGFVGSEIAEVIEVPPELDKAWHTHGYYGSVSHNVKAIYQRYLGWFDGNPASLWQHPPVESAVRYVECMGGAEETVAKAVSYRDRGDLRFAAELLNRVVFADPAHDRARELLADVYQALGFGSENGTWRNFYLMGALELRHGIVEAPATIGSAELLGALTVEQLFDAVAIRINGPACWDERATVDWVFTDLGQTHRTELRHGVLTHRLHRSGPEADLRLTLTKPLLLGMVTRRTFDGIDHDGDLGAVGRLLGSVEAPDRNFPIVTP